MHGHCTCHDQVDQHFRWRPDCDKRHQTEDKVNWQGKQESDNYMEEDIIKLESHGRVHGEEVKSKCGWEIGIAIYWHQCSIECLLFTIAQ